MSQQRGIIRNTEILNVSQANNLQLKLSVCSVWSSPPLAGNHGEGESAQLGPPGLRRGAGPRERRRPEEEPLLQHAEEVPRHQTGKTAGV